jgi:cytosine/creatinine deaminase
MIDCKTFEKTTYRSGGEYVVEQVSLPVCCWEGIPKTLEEQEVNWEGTVLVDIGVRQGSISFIQPSGQQKENRKCRMDAEAALVLPTFVDLHTHIDKGHTAERSMNTLGSLSGADRSTAADAMFWDAEDVELRMDFSVRCAWAHGTSALRTHLINMTEKHTELTWPAFAKIRDRWKGKVELQGVSLVALSFFRDVDAAEKLADVVQEHGGLLGAAVCCAEQGGSKEDDWTTCDTDRDILLDRIFTLAKERDLDIDFHTDENGNELARGLRYVAEKTIEHGYEGRVVCGHCCSLAYQPPDELKKTLDVVARAGITVVSLPLVNQWTQDRRYPERTTPLWRGITLLHEVRDAKIPVAIASDNTRDQFYAYGDLDMLEVFNQGCRMAHLDRPYGSWVRTVTTEPANAMKLRDHGRIRVGGPANFILFPTARKYSELLSRPQYDRIVVRDGLSIDTTLPSYRELDCVTRMCSCDSVHIHHAKVVKAHQPVWSRWISLLFS